MALDANPLRPALRFFPTVRMTKPSLWDIAYLIVVALASVIFSGPNVMLNEVKHRIEHNANSPYSAVWSR